MLYIIGLDNSPILVYQTLIFAEVNPEKSNSPCFVSCIGAGDWRLGNISSGCSLMLSLGGLSQPSRLVSLQALSSALSAPERRAFYLADK